MKVLVGGISHESNTFANAFTGRQEFEASHLAHGDDVPRLFLGTNTEVGGFLASSKANGIEPTCSLVAHAEPSGPVVRATYEEFKERILADLRRTRFDGVYLALHGAMTVQGLGDGEGDLLRAVREVVGPEVPVVATLDLHTLLTDAMLESADALVVYKTYPHVDMADRAAEAARLLARIAAGEVRPVAGCCRLPLLAPPTRMRTDAEPMRSVGQRMVEMETSGLALSASFNHSFPYSDFPYTGAGALVYADGDRTRADELAHELADYVWERRASLRHTPTSVADAVARALAHPTRAGRHRRRVGQPRRRQHFRRRRDRARVDPPGRRVGGRRRDLRIRARWRSARRPARAPRSTCGSAARSIASTAIRWTSRGIVERLRRRSLHLPGADEAGHDGRPRAHGAAARRRRSARARRATRPELGPRDLPLRRHRADRAEGPRREVGGPFPGGVRAAGQPDRRVRRAGHHRARPPALPVPTGPAADLRARRHLGTRQSIHEDEHRCTR